MTTNYIVTYNRSLGLRCLLNIRKYFIVKLLIKTVLYKGFKREFIKLSKIYVIVLFIFFCLSCSDIIIQRLPTLFIASAKCYMCARRQKCTHHKKIGLSTEQTDSQIINASFSLYEKSS